MTRLEGKLRIRNKQIFNNHETNLSFNVVVFYFNWFESKWSNENRRLLKHNLT